MLFHRHRWQIISADDYTKSNPITHVVTEHYTNYSQICGCGKVRTQTIDGHHAKALRKQIVV